MFSQEHADVAYNFFHKHLKHTADDWYGQPFILAPWQDEATSAIFGNIDDVTGLRTIEMAYMEVPKKAGKTEWAAGIILLLFLLEETPGCQIYGAAAGIRQAQNVYRAAVKMIEQNPELMDRWKILRSTNRVVKRNDPESFYAAIAGDGDMGDGVNPTVVVADEIHRWRTRKQIENWDVLSNGGITRKQTLTVAITTAGVQNESPLAWRLHEKTRNIERGVIKDPKFYGRIYAADPKDDPASDDTYIKANPSLKQNGGFLDIQKVRDKYQQHLSEGDLTSFKRYFLNIWDQKESHAIEMDVWDASAGPWQAQGLLPEAETIKIKMIGKERKLRPLPIDLLAQFAHRRCWAGVDLSMTTDMSSVVFLFPKWVDNELCYDVLPFFWLPEKNLKQRELRLGVPLRQWRDEGFIEVCEGGVIDYREIQYRLEWGAQVFDVQNNCWDPWNSRQISLDMIDYGYPCVEVRQGYQSLSQPTKECIALDINGRLHHGNHPVLRWNAGCASTVTDGKDNIMFVKPDRFLSVNRIDGMSSLVNAMYDAIQHKDDIVPYTGLRSV